MSDKLPKYQNSTISLYFVIKHFNKKIIHKKKLSLNSDLAFLRN